MNHAQKGVPAYLTQLAGRPPAAAAPLQPRRPLFDPTGGNTITEQPWGTGDSVPTPIAGSRAASRSDHAPTGSTAAVGDEDRDVYPAEPAPVPRAGSIAVGVPVPAVIAPAPALAPVPPVRPIPPRVTSAHDARPTATAVLAPTAEPLIPQVVPAATPTPEARPEQPSAPPDLVPPGAAAPPVEADPSPALAPPPHPANAAQELLLPRATVSGAVLGEPAPPRRSAAVPSVAAPAQVSIGTIEVTVVGPRPIAAPAPATHPLATRAHAPARGGVDLALHGARGASRRWFGAGQS